MDHIQLYLGLISDSELRDNSWTALGTCLVPGFNPDRLHVRQIPYVFYYLLGPHSFYMLCKNVPIQLVG